MKAAGRRTFEIGTAIAVGAAGAVVSMESLTHDVGWNATGPGPGYFPFRVGLLLMVAAAVLCVQHLRAAAGGRFATREEVRRTLRVFWPTVMLVAGMFVLGCYVPSAAYLAWMMRRHGGYGWARSVVSGIAVMAAFFIVFDIWFRVPLAKGPVESALGIY